MEPIMMKAAEIERLNDAEVRDTDQIVKPMYQERDVMYQIYVIRNPHTGRRLVVATDDWEKFQQRAAIMPLLIYGGFIVVPVMTCKKREYRHWLDYQIWRHMSHDPRFGYNHAGFGLDVSGTRT